jgi:dihydropteroate synthase
VLNTADHTLIMGILNVTPDSFSDGGSFLEPDDAVRHGLEMLESGADLIDIGGESTRPGADPVAAALEIDRVVPVVEGLAQAGALVSIDTSKAEVAAAAIAAGAAIVNDVTALGDVDMASVVAESGAGLVLMHMQGEPRTMQQDPTYEDVVSEVAAGLAATVEAAVAAGINPDQICLDPGIGFGKTVDHNLDLLTLGVERLAETGHPVLVGASRKSFIASLLGPIEPEERDVASAAAHVLAIASGASVLRVHNVVTALRSARIADAIVRRVHDRP